MSGKNGHFYEFGGFRLDAENHGLWLGDKLVSIAPKALEVLILLVRRHGNIVSRDDFLKTVWRDTFVEEANINYTVSQLRKILGEHRQSDLPFIQTVSKHGYRFVADVKEVFETENDEAKNPAKVFDAVSPTAVSNLNTPLLFRRGLPPALKEQIHGHFIEIAVNGQNEPITGNGQNTKEVGQRAKSEIPNPKTAFSSAPFRFAVGAVLLAILGFAGFRFWSGQTEKKSFAPIENVNFQKLTFTGDLTFPVLAPDGNSFAFVRGDGLFIQDVNSGDAMRLNVEGEKVFGILQFSPDGESLFYRNRVGFDLAANVFQVSRFGGRPKLIAENVWSGFGFSPDGKQMSFTRVNPNEGASSLIIKNLETGAERKLAALNLPSVFLDNGHSAWSPDGQKIAVVIFKNLRKASASGLAVVDAESGEIEEINCPSLWQFEQVAWLTGNRDLIIAARENGKFFQLWRLAYPGGEVQKITNDLNIYRGISISADGKKLLARQFTLYSHLWVGEKNDLANARQKTFGNLNRDGTTGLNWMPNGDILYVTRIMGDADLWLYRPSDDSRRQLTKNVAELNENPVAASDGKFIYFNTNRSGANHIWRMDASGANPTQITFGEKQTELYPQISPDGAWLYYIQKSTPASTVWRKSLTDDRAEALTEASKLAPGGFLSISPDGKFLAFHNAVEKVAEEDAKPLYQIAVIPTDKRGEPEFYNIAASRLIVRWTSDGAAFDYIENNSESARIWRQTLDGDKPPTIVVDLPKTFLHNFAWSADGEKLVFSRGQQLNDAILLTNFQP